MANLRQNRAYLPHQISDPHTHPILLLQKLVNLTIEYEDFIKQIKNPTFSPNFVVVNNLPYSQISNELINLINKFDFPVVLKTSDYHTFVVNRKFVEFIFRKDTGDYVWKEKNFDVVDKFIVDYLKRHALENYRVLSDFFMSFDINKTIDAFTTPYFYNFYKYVEAIGLRENELEVYFLVDSKWFLDNPDVLMDKKCLGIKFFVDGTISSKTAWMGLNEGKCLLDMEIFRNVLDVITRKFNNRLVYLAFHAIGFEAFRFIAKEIVPSVLKKQSLPFIKIRIEHCNFMRREDLEFLVDLIGKYNKRGVFLVLNPEYNTFSLFDLYKYSDVLGICYASDAPVYSIDLKDSIFKHLKNPSENIFFEESLKIVKRVFNFNEQLFNVIVREDM